MKVLGSSLFGWFACGFLLTNATVIESRQFDSPNKLRFFEKKIRPILVKHCYRCHSANSKSLKGGLRLDHRNGLFAGGESGKAIVSGKPEESLLIRALEHGDLKMPPDRKLGAEIITDFRKWIGDGTIDPRTKIPKRNDGSDRGKPGRNHWSYQPLGKAVVPTGPCGQLTETATWGVSVTTHIQEFHGYARILGYQASKGGTERHQSQCKPDQLK